MNSFIEQVRCYAIYHQNPINRYLHFIAVPLIVFSIMVLFGFLHLVIPNLMNITLAGLCTLALLGYYYYLNWRLALAVTFIFIVLLWFAELVSRDGPTSIASWTFIISFLLGLSLILSGHFVEEKRPTALDGLRQFLNEPMYLTAEVFFLFGYLLDLREKIQQGDGKDSTSIKVKD